MVNYVTTHRNTSENETMGFRLCHWGPFIALSIILSLSTCGIYSMFLLWHPRALPLALPFNLIPFVLNVTIVLYNFLNACFRGPGRVPTGWRPADARNEADLQYCDVCEAFKAPRAHHCSTCGRCSLRMDHHCPWINNCVGHSNQSAFILFLGHVVIGCLHALVLMSMLVYRAMFIRGFVQTTFLPYTSLMLLGTLLAIGLAAGVTISVGFLLVIQMRNVSQNVTEIERWIIQKANSARRRAGRDKFAHPYDVGCWRNATFVWREAGNGVEWPVRDNCDQYTFTREQLAQKRRKRDATVPYVVKRDYSGRRDYCGVCYGCSTACHCPGIDSPRLDVSGGDIVMVTRANRRWLYGNKVLGEYVEKLRDGADSLRPNQYSRERGWFPRACAESLRKDQ